MQQIFWFLVTLAILIPIHEYGHYRVAKACGVKVLRFSIGFGRVFYRRTFGADKTEFVLSMLPLGGYVKMLDEREAAVDPADLPRAFNRRPLYQRALVVAAGPAANLLLALVLYAFVQWYGTDQPAPVASTPIAGSLVEKAGLRSGDRIIAAAEEDASEDDWQDVRSFKDVYDAIDQATIDHQALQLRIARAGEPGTRVLHVALDGFEPEPVATASARLGLGAPMAAPRIGDVVAGSAASLAGLQAGDLVRKVDGASVADAQALRGLIMATGQGSGAPRAMQWEIERRGAVLQVPVTPRIDQVDGERVARVGVAFGAYDHVFVREDALSAFKLGAQQTWRQASGSLRMFGQMITGEASLKNLGGPGTIAEVATSSAHQGFAPFLAFLAMVSVGLGVLNLLPIPMLDGGMLLYYLFEGATGRPVSELWQLWLQRGGALILLLLMSLALSNDVARHLGLQ